MSERAGIHERKRQLRNGIVTAGILQHVADGHAAARRGSRGLDDHAVARRELDLLAAVLHGCGTAEAIELRSRFRLPNCAGTDRDAIGLHGKQLASVHRG
eukprot:scaffold27256_cov56-Phaeocystis_antarctica.AAC.5